MTLAEYARNLLPTLTEAQANSVAGEYSGLEGGNVTAQAALIYGEGKFPYCLSLSDDQCGLTTLLSVILICPTYTLLKGFKGPSYKIS